MSEPKAKAKKEAKGKGHGGKRSPSPATLHKYLTNYVDDNGLSGATVQEVLDVLEKDIVALATK